MSNKFIKFLVFSLVIIFSRETFAGNFVYPFDKIADPKCRFNDRSTLWDECKITIPKIEKADYSKYKNNQTYRRVYSILWSWTYNYWWDAWYGSHLWVDIATSKWTPVRSIWDWTVIIAGNLSGRWNTVSIKHTIEWWKYIYSNYSHLSKINISKWATVKAGQYIWEVWATGNAYGNHLHFQIDTTNQSHPYWYISCASGKDIMKVVNDWDCKDFMNNNTIDPILFLEKWATYSNVEKVKEEQKKTKVDPKQIQETREKVINDEISEFFRKYSLKIDSWTFWDNYEIWKDYKFTVYVKDSKRPFNWILPGNWLDVVYDKKWLQIFPEKLLLIEDWVRVFSVKWIKTWQYNIDFKIWQKILYTFKLNVYKPWEFATPFDAKIISTTKKSYIGDEFMNAIVFRNKYQSYQYNIPFDWRYVVKLLTWNGKMCSVSKNKDKKCTDYSKTVQELEFGYYDTINWIMLFNFIPVDFNPVEFGIYKKWSNKLLGRLNYNVFIGNPKDLDKQYTYYNENMTILKKWILRTKDWYTLKDREINGKQLKNLIDNYVWYELLKAWLNRSKREIALSKSDKWSGIRNNFDDYRFFTRWEASKILFNVLWLDIYPIQEKYLDQKWDFEKYISTLTQKYNFKWKDQFWEKYFQPNKKITIWEFNYLLDKLTQ